MKYNEFPDIEIPEFLNTPEWTDTSWHNNSTATSEWRHENSELYCLEVWVNPSKKAHRESWSDARYIVTIYDVTQGYTRFEAECRTTKQAIKAIQQAKVDLAELLKSHPV